MEKKNQKQKDGCWQQVDTYGYTNNFPVGHGEKSIIQIMRFMYLTEEEVLAIRWHMGAFDNAVKGGSYDMNYAFAQSRLAAMLHIADMMATHLDERGQKPMSRTYYRKRSEATEQERVINWATFYAKDFPELDFAAPYPKRRQQESA